ncbi:MAG: hypothetical protein ACOYNO_09890 [Saprospiraceae bacterium]
MKKMLFVMVACLGFWYCQPEKPVDKNQVIAKAYCECTQGLVELNNRNQQLSADTNAVLNLQAIQTEFESAKTCTATLMARYGKLSTEDQKAVMAQVATACPALANKPELLRELLGQ